MRFPSLKTKIKGEHIFLALPEMQDAQAILHYTRSTALMKFMAWRRPKNLLEVKKNIRNRWQKAQQKITFETCVYFYDNTFVGSVGIVRFDYTSETAELGYWIGEKFWKKGIGTEAISVLIDYAFNTLKAHRLVIKCNPLNMPSRKLAEKAGFTLDGILRSHAKINGQYTDKCFYSLLKNEWGTCQD